MHTSFENNASYSCTILPFMPFLLAMARGECDERVATKMSVYHINDDWVFKLRSSAAVVWARTPSKTTTSGGTFAQCDRETFFCGHQFFHF